MFTDQDVFVACLWSGIAVMMISMTFGYWVGRKWEREEREEAADERTPPS